MGEGMSKEIGDATVAQSILQAAAYHQSGKLQEAMELYRAILQDHPNHPEVNHNMGVLAVQMKQPASALSYLMSALETDPARKQYWLSYIDALFQLGQFEAAREVLALAQHNGLAGEEVDALVLRLVESAGGMQRPPLADRHELDPTLPVPPVTSQESDNSPNSQEINELLSLFATEQYAEALKRARRITECFPSSGFGWKALGAAFYRLGRHSEALLPAHKAAALLPGDAEAHINFANALSGLGRLNEAVGGYRKALQINPDYAEAHYNLGITLKELGRLDEAEDSYRNALRSNPDLLIAHSNLLYLQNHNPSGDPLRCLAEARQFGQKVGNKIPSRFNEWTCPMEPARLRIGFVSGDFRIHPVGYFLESVLEQIDGNSIELIAYPTIQTSDELTARIKPRFLAWKPLSGLSDEEAARMIHSDNIHVLIDLSGHTCHNRLPIFAWKPAPVQVSWLGYFATTGISEIDYFIADNWTLPENEPAFFTEKIWRLPETRLCFTPPDIDIEVSPLPALSNGYVTFGSFNNLSKMNDEVVALWSRVLSSAPNSLLFLKAKQLKETSIRQHVIERFAQHGIRADRLVMEGHESRAKYLSAYHRVDIALDTFPFPGGTTSVEGLWMGVPVLTLTGGSLLSRQGMGILMNAGLQEWVAADADDFVFRASTHASDVQHLARLRSGLRQQVLATPLFDAARFARHFEAALWGMWKRAISRLNTTIV